MAQFGPRRRDRSSSVERGRRSDGSEIDVASTAVNTMRTSLPDALPQRSVADQIAGLGYDEICAAAVAAGHSPPAKRTVRQWRQQGRIPKGDIADLVARRDIIARLGGPEAAARALGRSKSAVYAWRAGRTGHFLPDAGARLTSLRAALRLRDAGIDPATQTPKISFVASVVVRSGNKQYDYRDSRRFTIGGVPGTQDYAKAEGTGLGEGRMSADTVAAFADALARDDYSTMISILEEYVSTSVASFDVYDSGNGFHFESISDVRITWS